MYESGCSTSRGRRWTAQKELNSQGRPHIVLIVLGEIDLIYPKGSPRTYSVK